MPGILLTSGIGWRWARQILIDRKKSCYRIFTIGIIEGTIATSQKHLVLGGLQMNELRPTARMEEIVVLDRNDETLVYDLRSNQAHCLNHTAALVWRSCDGSNTVVDICRLIEEKYSAQVTDDFVWFAIDQLQDVGLVTNEFSGRKPLASRREMLKRIGLATVVAVPIIASVVAPRSAYAAASCACVNPGACLTQTTCPSQVNCNGAGICAP